MSAENSPDPADHARRMESILRLGTIDAVDHAACRARVKTGGILTEWLPWFERRAGTTRDWDPPTVGEQCMVLSLSGETAAGVIMTGIFSDAHPTPCQEKEKQARIWPDQAWMHYDHVLHDYLLDVPVGGKITLRCGRAFIEIRDDHIQITAPRIDLN